MSDKAQNHALRGSMLIVKASARAKYLAEHDQVEAALPLLIAAEAALGDMKRYYPGTSELEVAAKAYDITYKRISELEAMVLR